MAKLVVDRRPMNTYFTWGSNLVPESRFPSIVFEIRIRLCSSSDVPDLPFSYGS